MAYAEVLAELASQVRNSTLRALDAAPDARLTWSPPPTSNHILWHAGHALWLQDLMCVELLSGQSELPDGWAATFGEGSQPGEIREWPSRDELRSRLKTQLHRLLELFEETADELLSRTPTSFESNRTTLGWIIHGLHDEAKHNGEMHLLAKLSRNDP